MCLIATPRAADAHLAAKLPSERKSKGMFVEQIEREIGKALPDSYKRFLNAFDDFCYVNYNEFKDEFSESTGTPWFCWSEKRLGEISIVDGATKDRMAWEVLKSYAEINAHKGEIQRSLLERTQFLVAIAEDDGDMLFMDASDDFAVSVYMHDSGETKRLEDSFEAWLANTP